jgi:hypothetical protein
LKECTRKTQVHFLYIYNEDLTRKLEGMHWKSQVPFLYMHKKGLIRKLEGMHQEDPGAFSIFLQQGFDKEA